MNNLEEEVVNFLNDYIDENYGKHITIDSKIMDADMDSFSNVMLYVELDDKYTGAFDSNTMKLEDFDYESQTVRGIVDRIAKCT